MLSATQGTAVSWMWRVGPGCAQRAASITAFDATPAMLEKARAHCEKASLENIIFREGNAQAMPFEDASFDGVVTRLAMHHFTIPQDVMNEVFRVLKPGGRAIIVSENPEEAALQNAIEMIRDPSQICKLP